MEKYCFAGEVREYLKQHKITRKNFVKCGHKLHPFGKTYERRFSCSSCGSFQNCKSS